MRSIVRALLALVLLLPALAWAQYACAPPGLFGTVLAVDLPKWRAEGVSVVWLCDVGGEVKPELLLCATGSCLPRGTFAGQVETAAKAADPRTKVAELMKARGAQPCPKEPDLATTFGALCAKVAADAAALKAAYIARTTPPPPPPDVPTYAVKPNPNAADGSRPTAILDANGVDRVSTGRRVAKGTACDCARLSSPSTGTDKWCHVGPEPREVGLCALQQP